jgi:hypothetical protein
VKASRAIELDRTVCGWPSHQPWFLLSHCPRRKTRPTRGDRDPAGAATSAVSGLRRADDHRSRTAAQTSARTSTSRSGYAGATGWTVSISPTILAWDWTARLQRQNTADPSPSSRSSEILRRRAKASATYSRAPFLQHISLVSSTIRRCILQLCGFIAVSCSGRYTEKPWIS